MNRQTVELPNRQKVGRRIVGLLSAAVGILLFVYAVHRAGFGEVARGVARTGWGFAIVLLLSGLRLTARSLAWIQCLETGIKDQGSGARRSEGSGTDNLREHVGRGLKPGAALRAILVGEALGNVTPLGLFISEPAKATFVHETVPISSGLPALAVENIFYSVSVALVIGAGMLVLLGQFDVPAFVRLGSLGALAFVAVVLGTAALVMTGRWRPARGVMRLVLRTSSEPWIERIGGLEDRIYGFARAHPGRIPAIAALELGFHVAGVAEAYVVLSWLGVSVTLVTAFVLESVNRVINVLFRFVPLRLGVDEAGSGLLTQVLGLGAPTGVTLAIIRKARVLAWSAVGILLLAQRAIHFKSSKWKSSN
ncbi:MAG: flippase-like domain-containing protein [Acidobacteria bacterium]|nr:flippase-like domain-containing protein [Acidobacteriota bacterium]